MFDRRLAIDLDGSRPIAFLVERAPNPMVGLFELRWGEKLPVFNEVALRALIRRPIAKPRRDPGGIGTRQHRILEPQKLSPKIGDLVTLLAIKLDISLDLLVRRLDEETKPPPVFSEE